MRTACACTRCFCWTPFELHEHDAVFGGFAAQEASLDKRFLHDFVGTKTSYEYDCEDCSIFRLGRRIACKRHGAFKAMDVASLGVPLLCGLPVMDEEYFERISLLQAVTSYAGRQEQAGGSPTSPTAPIVSRPFVVAEFGARYGAWAVRGARAALSKVPGAQVHVCAVESDPALYKWMVAHLERDVPPSAGHFLVHGTGIVKSGEGGLADTLTVEDR